MMTATLEIENTWDCSHHLLGYIALMDPTALPAACSPQNTLRTRTFDSYRLSHLDHGLRYR